MKHLIFIISVIIVLIVVSGSIIYYVSEIENKRINFNTCTMYRWKNSLIPSHSYSYTEQLTIEKCEELKRELLK